LFQSPLYLIATSTPPALLAIPFILLLLLIATGPLFFKSFWGRHYKKIAVAIGLLVLLFYLFILTNFETPIKTAFEYFSFISLLTALYVASGGIYIQADLNATPVTNALLLLFGAVISNIVGTTGAAILLIRPFLLLNKHRMKPYHVVFFIFIVCNIGGALTPMGPPLFLGYLKGVPFEWMLTHIGLEWVVTLVLVLGIFLIFEFFNRAAANDKNRTTEPLVRIKGGGNFIWLIMIIGSVFLDPAVFPWLPTIHDHSFVRELIQLAIAFGCYKGSNRQALRQNNFHFEPILEVAFLFFGIFMSMMPALELLSAWVNEIKTNTALSPGVFYWTTGLSSSVLDNAPAYLTFLTAAMSLHDLSVNDPSQVLLFATDPHFLVYLKGISIASVFFGAMTYIGNGPNFMVKSHSGGYEF
jgi:Na+/H+ antiporter NhaD/arsenite permease-like protein